MYRIFLTFVLVLSAGTTIFPQDPNEIHKKIMTAVDAREYAGAAVELQNLEKSDPKGFAINNYDYLLARMAEANDDPATAMVNYQTVVRRDSILKAYALFHLSRIFRESGNLLLERLNLQQLLLTSPNSLVAHAARKRLAKSSFESGNFAETIQILTTNTGKSGIRNSGTVTMRFAREDNALLGEAYLRNGKIDMAREIFTRLLNQMPNASQPDDVALTAAKSLDKIDVGAEVAGKSMGKSIPDLSELEHLRRANIYQFNRDFADAKLHFEAIIGKFASGAIAPDAAFQIGRGYAQQTDYAEALKWFERVQEQYPDSPSVKDALLQSAAAYGRVGKHREAIKRYQKFIEKFPSDEKIDRAYLNTVDILRDQGDDIEALKWTAKTRETFKGKTPEALALFSEVRIFLNRSEWANALEALDKLADLSDLGGVSVPGGTYPTEVKFLRGFVLEQSKRYADAIDVYLSIPDGRAEYYGWRATERLKKLASGEPGNTFIEQKLSLFSSGIRAKDADERRRNAQAVLRLTDSPEIRKTAVEVLRAAVKNLPQYQGIPAYKLNDIGRRQVLNAESAGVSRTGADELFFLGLYDEAAAQFESASPAMAAGVTDESYTLANIYRRGDRADRAVAFVEPLWKKVPADYPIEIMALDQLEMLYPAPYADALSKYAAPRGVDPRLLLAIMRQESRFQPDAKSNAAARGLMQFISTTSAKVAGELGRDSFRQEELYYPPTAILFGSQYLASLFKQFPNQPDAVVASYNGGDDNMKRWLSRAKSNLPDVYVPEIVYSQSKDYVYKVMSNYRMYQLIYDERLRPR